MRISSRSRLKPAAISDCASPSGKPPGPPARYTIGSGAGCRDAAGTIPTVRRIVRPFGLARFSGTTRKPQRASPGRVGGTGLGGHAAGTTLGTARRGLATAPAGDANGSAVATAAQIAISINETLRILAPPRLDAWSPSINLLLLSCQQFMIIEALTIQVLLRCRSIGAAVSVQLAAVTRSQSRLLKCLHLAGQLPQRGLGQIPKLIVRVRF